MKRQLRALAAAGLLVASSLVAVALGGSASADTQICEQYGSTTIQGRYVVQNNRWGTTAQQCINVTSNGFEITTPERQQPHQRRAHRRTPRCSSVVTTPTAPPARTCRSR